MKKEEKKERNFELFLLEFLDRPIAYHRIFVSLTGSVTAAVLLSQAFYWSRRSSQEDGWFYKSMAEWTEETGLSEEEQSTARKKLKATSFWQEKREGLPARLYYRINLQVLYSKLLNLKNPSQIPEKPESRSGESRKQEEGHSGNKPPGKPETGSGDFRKQEEGDPGIIYKETKNTTETTSEITTKTSLFVETEERENLNSQKLFLGKASSKQAELRVQKHLQIALSVFEAVQEARRRIDPCIKHFAPSYEQLEQIAERLEHGATLEQCLYVISLKEKAAAQNLDFLKWLNPITPFKAEHFARLLSWSTGGNERAYKGEKNSFHAIDRYHSHDEINQKREYEASTAYEEFCSKEAL